MRSAFGGTSPLPCVGVAAWKNTTRPRSVLTTWPGLPADACSWGLKPGNANATTALTAAAAIAQITLCFSIFDPCFRQSALDLFGSFAQLVALVAKKVHFLLFFRPA